jgi:hypothetical protein
MNVSLEYLQRCAAQTGYRVELLKSEGYGEGHAPYLEATL